MNVLRTTPPEEIRAAAERARRHREWLILMFHYLVQRPQGDTAYGISAFRRALEEIAEVGVPVRTISEVWREHGGAPPADSH